MEQSNSILLPLILSMSVTVLSGFRGERRSSSARKNAYVEYSKKTINIAYRATFLLWQYFARESETDPSDTCSSDSGIGDAIKIFDPCYGK